MPEGACAKAVGDRVTKSAVAPAASSFSIDNLHRELQPPAQIAASKAISIQLYLRPAFQRVHHGWYPYGCTRTRTAGMIHNRLRSRYTAGTFHSHNDMDDTLRIRNSPADMRADVRAD